MPNIELQSGTAHYMHGRVDPAANAGNRPVLVALHGAGGTHRGFGQLMYGVGAQWPVVVPDLPGHGDSEPLPGDVTIPVFADWVEALWAALCDSWGCRPPLVLLGHSMGGGIALEYTLTRTGDHAPVGLVLLSTGGRLRVRPDFLETLRGGAYPPELIQAVAANGDATDPDARRFQERVVASPGGAGVEAPPEVAYRDLLACDAFDRLEDLPRISAPTLVVQGDGDHMTPLKYGRRLAEAIPNARFELVQGAGHLAHAQKPGPVNKAVKAFLASLAEAQEPAT